MNRGAYWLRCQRSNKKEPKEQSDQRSKQENINDNPCPGFSPERQRAAKRSARLSRRQRLGGRDDRNARPWQGIQAAFRARLRAGSRRFTTKHYLHDQKTREPVLRASG